MSKVTDYPLLILAVVFVTLWASCQVGAFVLRKTRGLEEDLREDFGVILAATLTLLGLIIGFSFSMAVNRYDQRKNLEEAEANAIGTEYVRADLLPAPDAAKVRALLRSYLDQRISFYMTGNLFHTDVDQQLRHINDRTAQLQSKLWAAVLAPAGAQPTPIVALAVWGMNDVLNSQGYTQAAWLNRIPIAAWGLMLIAVCCNVLIGYGTRNPGTERILLLILPLVVAIALFLIADIDSPRSGFIHVVPQNLLSLAESLRVN